jgi:hypothetical protein
LPGESAAVKMFENGYTDKDGLPAGPDDELEELREKDAS